MSGGNEPLLLLRSEVKKEEDACSRHDCSPGDNSSLYSPTTTAGLQLEMELSQEVGAGGGGVSVHRSGSYLSTSPSMARSLSRSSPELDGDRESEKHYCSSTTTSSSSQLGSANTNRVLLHRSQVVGGEGLGVETIMSPVSVGLCRSISRSFSSPEPDGDHDVDKEYCSSTTATVPADFPRQRPQGEFKDDDAPKRLCLVCGDVASGFHYGVASCEACKAFFKRTIQGNIEYTCPAANDCEINKRRRKACQACRFQKCIRMGMLKEGVRLDRVRGGRQKYRRVMPYTLDANANNNKKIALEDNKILCTLGQCEPEMLSAADIMWPEGDSLANVDPSFRILCTLSELYDRELVAAIGWAKQIPGFLEMPLNDQMRLLQTSWPEVLTLSLAFRSIPVNSGNAKLQWSADFSMNEKEARECGMEELFFQGVQIAQRLEQLSVTREEYYLLKALVLINCDVRVESMAHVKKLRESVLSALSDCASALRQGSGASQMQYLLLCMPCIRQVDSSLRRFWAVVRRASRVPMNKLFLEMLESPLR